MKRGALAALALALCGCAGPGAFRVEDCSARPDVLLLDRNVCGAMRNPPPACVAGGGVKVTCSGNAL